MLLTLSNIAVGTPRVREHWNTRQPLDPLAGHVERHAERTRDWRLKQLTTPLVAVAHSLGEPALCHDSYLRYLELCWNQHLGAVIRPDDLWYAILCEVAGLIIADPEKYRHLFSETQEKQDIVVVTDALEVMPIDQLSSMLAKVVPMDASVFFPEFSTATPASRHAMQAAFCEMGTPYYDYSMMCCDIPLIDVRGDRADWAKLVTQFEALTTAIRFVPAEWASNVNKILVAARDSLTNAAFWKEILTLERCGSGSDVIVSGWWSKLYVNFPKQLAKPSNFAQHISKVPYKHLQTKKEYLMKVGLFSSTWDGRLLVPEYGFVVYEKLPQPLVQQLEDRDLPFELGELQAINTNG